MTRGLRWGGRGVWTHLGCAAGRHACGGASEERRLMTEGSRGGCSEGGGGAVEL